MSRFPCRVPLIDFIRQAHQLCPQVDDSIPLTHQCIQCLKALDAAETEYQIGKTQVMMTQGLMDATQNRMLQLRFSNAALTVQNAFRRYISIGVRNQMREIVWTRAQYTLARPTQSFKQQHGTYVPSEAQRRELLKVFAVWRSVVLHEAKATAAAARHKYKQLLWAHAKLDAASGGRVTRSLGRQAQQQAGNSRRRFERQLDTCNMIATEARRRVFAAWRSVLLEEAQVQAAAAQYEYEQLLRTHTGIRARARASSLEGELAKLQTTSVIKHAFVAWRLALPRSAAAIVLGKQADPTTANPWLAGATRKTSRS